MTSLRRPSLARDVAALLALAACAAPPRPELAADALFHQDPRWRGGDGAYSIDLGAERSLWLFGDSFVARPDAVGRSGCAMPRNTIALMTGDDPRTAKMEFAWRGTVEQPASWFPDDGEVWHWPLHGLRTGDAVIAFATRLVRDGEGIFGFRAVGWTAFRITGIDASPRDWRCERLATPDSPFAVVVGTAVVAEGDFVHAYALREPGDHALFVLRWRRDRFARAELMEPEWFDGGAWRPHATLREAPAPILRDAAPEFSVHRDAAGRFVMAQVLGFPAGRLAVRTSPGPEGPWSEAQLVFTPPESARERVFVYAGKAHPQLAGEGLLMTYASNHADFGTLVGDLSLYWPRFVRVPAPRD
ncbi:MAG: DUF4185 domain-containing protein [Planctomycetes bacterium]|nr:DUF4185 domain-containing protein [Planctomycetota bacterium]